MNTTKLTKDLNKVLTDLSKTQAMVANIQKMLNKDKTWSFPVKKTHKTKTKTPVVKTVKKNVRTKTK